jgi:galactose-1-phosphate uridylyltransferase
MRTIDDGKETAMAIQFKCEPISVEVLDPAGKPVQYTLERRFDPLTSRSSLICPTLREKWRTFYGCRDEQWLRQISNESKRGCPFCSPTIDQVIPRFPQNRVPEGVLKFGDVYVFPNLFPRTEFEAVVTSSNVHFLNLNEFTEQLLYGMLTAAFECISRVYSLDNSLAYPVVGTNYLPPAGASLIHFHQQIAMQKVPFTHIRNLMECSARYGEAQNNSFWQDFMAANDERRIEQSGNIYWYVPFAPSGSCEVQAIVNACNFLQFEAEDMRNLARGLCNVLKYYHHRGFDSFNCLIYSGSLQEPDGFRAGLSIITRPNVRRNYSSIDSWFMPLMLRETVVPERPEELAREIRAYLQGGATPCH